MFFSDYRTSYWWLWLFCSSCWASMHSSTSTWAQSWISTWTWIEGLFSHSPSQRILGVWTHSWSASSFIVSHIFHLCSFHAFYTSRMCMKGKKTSLKSAQKHEATLFSQCLYRITFSIINKAPHAPQLWDEEPTRFLLEPFSSSRNDFFSLSSLTLSLMPFEMLSAWSMKKAIYSRIPRMLFFIQSKTRFSLKNNFIDLFFSQSYHPCYVDLANVD